MARVSIVILTNANKTLFTSFKTNQDTVPNEYVQKVENNYSKYK
jgi:hypothetical protein